MKKTSSFLYAFYLLALLLIIGCKEKSEEKLLLSKTSIFDSIMYFKPIITEVEAKIDHVPIAIEKKLNSAATEHSGIDISHYQGDISDLLEKKPDGLQFIICKATQSTDYVDPMFRTNWNNIAHGGFIRGAYHFYDCSKDPIEQAEHFGHLIADIQDYDISPILDIEQGSLTPGLSAKEIENDALIFLKEIEKITHRKPIIYSDYGFFQEYFTNPEFTNYRLWLAEYSGTTAPKIPTLWEKKGFAIWQKSSSYSVNGIQSDLDVVKGSLKQIVKL